MQHVLGNWLFHPLSANANEPRKHLLLPSTSNIFCQQQQLPPSHSRSLYGIRTRSRAFIVNKKAQYRIIYANRKTSTDHRLFFWLLYYGVVFFVMRRFQCLRRKLFDAFYGASDHGLFVYVCVMCMYVFAYWRQSVHSRWLRDLNIYFCAQDALLSGSIYLYYRIFGCIHKKCTIFGYIFIQFNTHGIVCQYDYFFFK